MAMLDKPDTSLRSKANNLWWNSCFPAEPFPVGLKAITLRATPVGRRCEPLEEDHSAHPPSSPSLLFRLSSSLAEALCGPGMPAGGDSFLTCQHSPHSPTQVVGDSGVTTPCRPACLPSSRPPPVTPTRLGSCSSTRAAELYLPQTPFTLSPVSFGDL